MALDKFFCKVPETKVTDKQIEFHSEKEANEYCRDNSIDPHNVILMGDKYIIKTKDSNFRTTMDEAIRLCDVSREEKAQNFREFDRKILRFRGTGTWKEFCDLSDQITKVYNNGGLLKSDSATLQKHYSQIERYVLSREREKAIAAKSGGKMESFITLNEAKMFAEKLKKQGIKATITGVEDKRNGVYVYRVTWN